jgi:hypothetical protein
MKQRADLENALESILVDTYDDADEYSAFYNVIDDQIELPVSATLLGMPVVVTGLTFTNEARGLTATCEGPHGSGEVTLADLAFPPDTVLAWIHAAYRYRLGAPPFPAKRRRDWTWPN